MTRSAAIMMVALVATMSFLGAAVANEKDNEPQSALPTPLIVVDEEAGTMVIALPVDSSLPDCGDITAALDKGEGFGPGDCIEIEIEHPSGKTHHGAIVSAAAKELHPSTLDGIKKGEIMRWVAKPSNGGGEEPTTGEPTDGGDTPDDDSGDKPDIPGNGGDNPGNGNGGDNPGNGNGGDNPGNGNGNGGGNSGNGNGPNK